MAVPNTQVRAALDLDEPDYEEAAAQFSPEVLPLLQRFMKGGDPYLADKAAYLAR